MLTENTLTKLYEIRMGVIAEHFKRQTLNSVMNELTFEERFGLLVDAEWSSCKSNSLKRLIKNAGYAISNASVVVEADEREYALDHGFI